MTFREGTTTLGVVNLSKGKAMLNTTTLGAGEHPIVAENYEHLYSYSEDGTAPFQPNTVMPDPLEWLGFAAGCTTNIKLGTGVLLLPLHSPIIIALFAVHKAFLHAIH